MKLVTKYTDSSEADSAYSAMQDAGIMVQLTSKASHQLSSTKTGALEIGLWVVVDEQLDDARMLLRNPKHIPSMILTFEQMDTIERKAGKVYREASKRLFERIATLSLGAFLLVFLVYVFYGIYSNA